MRARGAKKKRTDQLSHGNGRVIELKLIKQVEVLLELKQFGSANEYESSNFFKLLQGRCCMVMVKSSTQRILDRRKQYRMAICGQGMPGYRKTEQLSLGNGKVMELKLIKHDEAL